jgi:hypothetical protein
MEFTSPGRTPGQDSRATTPGEKSDLTQTSRTHTCAEEFQYPHKAVKVDISEALDLFIGIAI